MDDDNYKAVIRGNDLVDLLHCDGCHLDVVVDDILKYDPEPCCLNTLKDSGLFSAEEIMAELIEYGNVEGLKNLEEVQGWDWGVLDIEEIREGINEEQKNASEMIAFFNEKIKGLEEVE